MAGARVLVVEDEAIVRIDIEDRLKRLGYTVPAVASSGEEAIRQAAETRPDLVLMDIKLRGDMDGVEAAEEIRTRFDIPVVYLTAFADEETLQRAKVTSPFGYILKPLEVRELKSAIEIALYRHEMEKRVRESEARYRAVSEVISDFAYALRVEPDGSLAREWAAGAFTHITGFTFDEMHARGGLESLVHPDDAVNAHDHFQSILSGHQTVSDFRIITKDQEVRWLRHYGRPMWDENRDHITGIIGAVQDISEQKRLEGALRRRISKQTALYTIASAASTFMDSEKLLSTTLDVVIGVLNADAGWVVLTDTTDEASLHIAAWRNIPESFRMAEKVTPLQDCPIYISLLERGDVLPELMLLAQCPCLPREVLAEIDLHSHVGIPLSVSEGKMLGVLNIAWRTRYPASKMDWPLLTAIGQQVGLALRNKQLYQEAQQVDRLQILDELDRMLAATLDLETIAEITLRHIADAVGAQASALFLLSPQDTPQPVRAFTTRQDWITIVPSIEDTQVWQAFLRRMRDNHEAFPLSEVERPALDIYSDLAERWGPHGIVIPVWSDHELVVGLALGGRSMDEPFSDEDRALAQAAASRASQAIQNARLFQASQSRADRLAILNVISTAAVSSLKADVVLRQILELSCQALNAVEGSILLRVPETDDLFFAVTLSDGLRGLHSKRLSSDQGIAGWVAQHGEAVCVNDVRQDPRWYGGLDEVTGFETRSVMCVPLIYHGETGGVIEVVNKADGEFNDEDLSLLEAVASIAAAALENAHLYATMRSRVEELMLLNEIGLALSSSLDSSMVTHAALNQVRRLFHAEGVLLFEPDSETGELHCIRALLGANQVQAPMCLAPGESVAGWALQHRQPVLVEDAQNDPRFSKRVNRWLDCEVRAMMVAPLQAQERIIGVIVVIDTEPGSYSKDGLHTLQAIASVLAVALENARLYGELKMLLNEHQQAQAQLIQAEKMAALGRLVASLAHEINNPLQALRSGFSLLLSRRGDREKQRRYLEIASGEVERLITIVERVLDFYRPSYEQMEPTDINAVLDGTLLLVSKTLEHSRVTVYQELATNLLPVEAMADQLKQVFLNIILNAQQAMPDGGELTVRTGLSDREEVYITFTDTGLGISDDDKGRLFEPFFTTRPDGTGMGLAISYSIVERHGGRIEVDSEVDRGSTFTVILPAQRDASDLTGVG